MARILITGTLAYDDIGTFDTPWHSALRNVKLNRLDRRFGGCAMNIAYNLAGTGHHAVPFAYAGEDYSGDYAGHVARAGISESGIFRVNGTPSARGIVLTGRDGDQFTAFYPGPSGAGRWPRDLDGLIAADGPQRFDALVVAPDLPEKMAGCAERGRAIPLRAWCPGQYAETLDAAAIDATLRHCTLLVVNRHEWEALARHVDPAAVLARGLDVVVTDGPGPVTLLPGGERIEVPAPPAGAALDPTGCGDAFVAGLVGSLADGVPPVRAAVTGIGLAGRCLVHRGAQSHPLGARTGN